MKLHHLITSLVCLMLLGSGLRFVAGIPVVAVGSKQTPVVSASVEKKTVDKPTFHPVLVVLKEALVSPGMSFQSSLAVSILPTALWGFVVLLILVRRIEIFYFFFSFFRRLFGHHIVINAP